MTDSAPVVELRGITKSFGGVFANEDVDFTLRRGEIHALLGENGAGKSTLMSVLTGLYRPDAGEIRLRGERVVLRSPGDGIALGLGMVHQHFVQSLRHTALQNIVLGHRDLPLFPDWDALRARVAAAAGRYGLELDLDAPLHTLPVGERQKVEIVRALFRGSQILVMDEPTAVLSRQETAALFEVLRAFCADGGAVVFISHKLDEILEIADHVTVLRRGRNAGDRPVAGLEAATLAELMVGRELEPHRREAGAAPGAAVATLAGVSVMGPRGLPTLHDVDLEVRGGEILGIAGVAGSGQAELADLLAGLRRPCGGAFTLVGAPGRATPAGFRAAGVAYIPQDRIGTGLAGSLSITENLILGSYRSRFSRWGVLRWKAGRAWAAERIAADDIQCPGPQARTAGLSGGNLQKVILSRELAAEPKLIVAAYPCRGLDVGAAEGVRERLLEARGRGAAVVLLSEDLDELLALSDRIGVLFRGRLLRTVDGAEATRERIGLLMGGAS